MPSFRHLTHWYINWVLSCLNCGLSLLNFLQLCGLLFTKECCLCITMVSSFSFIAFTIMCLVPGSSCRGANEEAEVEAVHACVANICSQVGFGLFQLVKRRIEETHLRVCCFHVCVSEREREGQALFGEDSLENHTDLVLNYGRANQTVATMWSSPIKFQDLFFIMEGKRKVFVNPESVGAVCFGPHPLAQTAIAF